MKNKAYAITPATILFLVAIGLSLLVIYPFILTILTAMVLAYIFHPVFKKLSQKTKKPLLSAFLIVMLIVFSIAIPTLFLVNLLVRDIWSGFIFFNQLITNQDSLLAETPVIQGYLQAGFEKAASYIVDQLTSILIGLPNTFISLFLIFFLIYYFLKDGDEFGKRVKKALPFKKKYKDVIFTRFQKTTFAVVYGNVIVAIVQGIIAAIGFALFGVPSPVLWGSITVLTSFIPFLGAAGIWGPIVGIMLANAYMQGDSTGMFMALGLGAYGLFVISTVDNFLKPRIIGRTAKVHPGLVIVGVISGVAVFGFVGLVLGPVILSMAGLIIELSSEEDLWLKS